MAEIPRLRLQAMETWPDVFQNHEMTYKFDVVIHGVPMQFQFEDEVLLQALTHFFPKSWRHQTESPIRIFWTSPEAAGHPTGGWDDIADPNCQFRGDFVSQRDFLAKKLDLKTYQIMAPYELDDGIFNFLRYLLPLELIRQDKLLFHSSCVVVDSQEPYLFFGPSDAGKTTMVEFWLDQFSAKILGDDMNILSFEGNQVFVEAAALGQRFFDPKTFGDRFRLKKAFWITQSQKCHHQAIHQGQMAYFLSSFANLFWDQMDPRSYQKVFQLLGRLKADLPLFELFFPKSPEVISYVQSIHSDVSKEPRFSLADYQWRDNHHRSSRANLF